MFIHVIVLFLIWFIVKPQGVVDSYMSFHSGSQTPSMDQNVNILTSSTGNTLYISDTEQFNFHIHSPGPYAGFLKGGF